MINANDRSSKRPGPRSIRPTIPCLSSEIRQGCLSSPLWFVDWGTHFPKKMDGSRPVTAEVITYEEFAEFIDKHYADIFPGRNSLFQQSSDHPRRSYFYQEIADLFGFRTEGKLVGVFAGHPTDWNTYYVRTTGILQEFQGQGLLVGILAPIFTILAEHHVERVECDVDISNASGLSRLMKAGFMNTGQLLSERWGSVVKLTKFLEPRCENIFKRQFCSM